MKTKQLNILVKPTNDCNMNCTYCFDRKMREKLRGTRMSKSDVEHIVNLSADYAENVEFIWHGGEPTLMGKEFYEDVRTDIDVDYISI
ncbi:MAG: 4Fe-4S cluster-binding domain-containing protein, partial [Niameybacter sp.]|nr:4Fe-4S cluster-binding domain-containing protein [Niameybacter sp.]